MALCTEVSSFLVILFRQSLQTHSLKRSFFNAFHLAFAASAFLGKCGALIATIVFKYLKTDQIFYVCAGTSMLGALCTLLFSVDLTGVSLAEHDAQLELFLEGKVEEYKGKLNDPKHLSLYERMTGRHGVYDPDWVRTYVSKLSAPDDRNEELQ